MPTTRPWQRMMILALAGLLAAACGGGPSGPAEGTPPRERPAPSPAAGAPAPPAPRGSATITGTVRYVGEVPPLNPIKMDADPGCAKKHGSAVPSEVLVLGENNAVANVFVQVKGGLPAGSYPTPGEAAVLDQDGCRYSPHVLGVMVGQRLRILNSDGLLHNVHALPKINKAFNMAMPATRTEAEVTFAQEESMFMIKCDVHPWMGAYVAVIAHPYFHVTQADGRFSLSGLPAGRYDVEAWHEKLGLRTESVELTDGQTAQIDFTLTR